MSEGTSDLRAANEALDGMWMLCVVTWSVWLVCLVGAALMASWSEPVGWTILAAGFAAIGYFLVRLVAFFVRWWGVWR